MLLLYKEKNKIWYINPNRTVFLNDCSIYEQTMRFKTMQLNLDLYTSTNYDKKNFFSLIYYFRNLLFEEVEN